MEDLKDFLKGTNEEMNVEQKSNFSSDSGRKDMRVGVRGIFFHRFENFIGLRISEGRRPKFLCEVRKYVGKEIRFGESQDALR